MIRAKNDTGKYLGVPQDTGSDGIEIVTVSGTAVPSRCIWTVNLAYGGGCLVRSSYNSKYLFSSGGFLYTSSTTGTTGTAAYNARVWRIIDISSYGNTSSYTFRELTSGYSIKDLLVDIGVSKYPTVEKTPSDALWANAEDFTFSRSSGTNSCISITMPDNKFTGTNIGIATYTATHKVTNRTAIFTVYVDRFTYELINEFGFEDSDALLIRDVYNRIDAAYPSDSTLYRAWRSSRVLGGIIYDTDAAHTFAWSQVAGSVFSGDEDDYFTEILGFTATEYSQIKAAISSNYNKTNIADFAHMQISLAARLAYQLDKDGFLADIGEFCSEEDISYLAGWLGDATLKENDGQTSLKNDDYHADLDAENIYRLIAQGYTLVDAANAYYASLTSTNTRATVFLSYIDYNTIKSKIYTELIDKALLLYIVAAEQQENEELARYYYDLLADEQYHLDTVMSYPDTYNFMCSVRDGRSDIGSY